MLQLNPCLGTEYPLSKTFATSYLFTNSFFYCLEIGFCITNHILLRVTNWLKISERKDLHFFFLTKDHPNFKSFTIFLVVIYLFDLYKIVKVGSWLDYILKVVYGDKSLEAQFPINDFHLNFNKQRNDEYKIILITYIYIFLENLFK